MPSGKRRDGKCAPARGFAYLALMIFITMLGLVAAAGVKMGAVMQRAAIEQALLDIGGQFSDALKSYAEATPAGAREQPASLQDLLLDRRSPVATRHLRKIFIDPITGGKEWGLLLLPDTKGIIGVYSLAREKPFKEANFPPRYEDFSAKKSYRDWVFGPDQASIAAVLAPDPNVRQGIGRTLTSPSELSGTPSTRPQTPATPNSEMPGDPRPALTRPMDL